MDTKIISYEQYLSDLPPSRRSEIEKVWQVVRASVPTGYAEIITPKFLSFRFGEEWYVALANQKNYISLHLLPMYTIPELRAKFEASQQNLSKKLQYGKGCINFQQAAELPLAVISDILSALDAETYQKRVVEIRQQAKTQRAKKQGTQKTKSA